jgi:3-methyladenine DNA glycosylase AlkD
MNSHHKELLELIRKHSGKATRHTYLDNYLGNTHSRYPISIPVLRSIAKDWMKQHHHLQSKDIVNLLDSLIKSESSTEKCFAGILLGYATAEQRNFDPNYFDEWLDHMVGWAEIDSLCTGKHLAKDIPAHWSFWKKVIQTFPKSKCISKRRASIVLLCSPLSKVKDDRLAAMAFRNINLIKSEKDALITKAISWVLRSMVKHYTEEVKEFIENNKETLPKIAIRETLTKLKTGTKTKRK